MKRLGRLLSIITWLLVGGSMVVLTGGLFGRPLLVAAVPTGSMAPVLQPGDLIVVLPTWALPAAGPGDIVVYKTAGEPNWVVHRIIGGSGTEGFVIKGDANQTPDPGRVFPSDMVAVVPQVGGRALRLPHLGLLSTGSGPLSSPVVAAVALVLGVYLLVLEAGPSIRLPGLPRRRKRPARPEAVLGLYLGLAGTAFLTTLIPAWSMSTTQPIRYEVVAQRPINVKKAGQYLLGQPYQEEVAVKNPSRLPLIVVYRSQDPAVVYEPGWLLIPPRKTGAFTASVRTDRLGVRSATVDMGVFLPLLPPSLLAWLARQHQGYAVLATALVPACLVLAMALVDQRSRQAVNRLRYRFVARFLA